MEKRTFNFIKKLAIKVIIFTFIMVMVLFMMQSISPVVTNHLALSQMGNSDEAFVIFNTYNRFRPVFKYVFTGICILFTVYVAKDTYKFVKNIKNIEKEKDN